MILKDKEKVRESMMKAVNGFYYTGISQYSNLPHESDIGENVRKMVASAIEQHVSSAVREMGRTLVDVLVDGIYSAEDFEKDIGLKD